MHDEVKPTKQRFCILFRFMDTLGLLDALPLPEVFIWVQAGVLWYVLQQQSVESILILFRALGVVQVVVVAVVEVEVEAVAAVEAEEVEADVEAEAEVVVEVEVVEGRDIMPFSYL